MKKFIRKIIVRILGWEARLLLWRTKPEVIAITGSAGKTSCKEFTRKLLEIDFEVLATPEGYNTELGAPLAVFGERSPANVNSLFSWSGIIIKNFFKALFTRDYPQKLIIEMGADAPGDIKYLVSIFKPKLGVILTVLPTHLAEFKTEIAVAAEKSELAKAIGDGGKVFLNWDDEKVRAMAPLTKGQVIYFGTKNENGYVAAKVKTDIGGTAFRFSGGTISEDLKVRLYGKHMIYSIMAAIAVAVEEGVSIRKIKDELREISPFKGRMNIIEGVNGSLIIDDSYNANPASMSEALEFLADQKGRKLAILGSMNELGDVEKEAHEKVGKEAGGIVDMLVTVGEAAGIYLAPAAEKAGLKLSQVRSFKTATEAGEFLKSKVEAGDIILVKGSQNNVRTEKAIEVIMKDPMLRKNLLVRQSEFWQENA